MEPNIGDYLGGVSMCLVLGGWNCGVQVSGQKNKELRGHPGNIINKIGRFVGLRGIIGIYCNHLFIGIANNQC